jgi:hypothetical protein
MSTSNGINSDSFSRADVIKTYQVVQYFGGILTQYPIVYNVNLEYNSTTGMITANGITSFQATSGTTQTPLTISGANSNSATRPGATVRITGGNGSGGSGAGGVTIGSGNGGGVAGGTSISISNQAVAISGRQSELLSVDSGGVLCLGGYNDTGEINFTAGYNVAGTSGRPIIFATDSGTVLQIQEETPGTQKIGFFGKSPLSAKLTIGGSRGGNAALQQLLTALAALGLITDGTSA